MSKDKVTVLNGGNTPNLTADSVRQLKADLPMMIQGIALMAQLTKAKYDALVNEGFTEQQALELCRSI